MAKARIEIDFDATGVVKGLRVSGQNVDLFTKTLEGNKRSLLSWGRIMDNTIANLISGGIRRLTRGLGNLVRFGFRQLNDSIRLAGIQQIADRRLEQAILNTGRATDEWLPKLKAVAAEVQNLSNFGDEAIQVAQGFLLSFQEVAGPEGAVLLTKSLADTAAGVSKFTGETVDLNQIAALMGRALTNGAAALSRVGVSFTEAEKAAFDAAQGMDRVRILSDILQSNFRGLAEATADPLKQLENTFSDLKETLAEDLRPEINRLAAQVRTFLSDPQTMDAARRVGQFFVTVIQGVVKIVQISRAVTREFFARTAEDARAIVDVLAQLVKLQVQLVALIPGGANLTAFYADWLGQLQQVSTALGLVALENRNAARSHLETLDAMLAAGEAAKGFAGNLSGGAEGGGGSSVEGSSKKATTELGKLRDELAALKATFEELATTDPTKVFDIEDEVKRMKEQIEDARNSLRLLRAITRPEKVDLLGPDVPSEQDLQDRVKRTSEYLHAQAKNATEKSREMRQQDADEAAKSFEEMLGTAQATAGAIAETFQYAFEATGQESKALFAIFKAVSVAEAIVSTYAAVNKALPNFILAGAVLAAGLANVVKILATEPGSSNTGASGSVAAAPTNRTGGETQRQFPLPGLLGTPAVQLADNAHAAHGTTETVVTLEGPRQKIEGDNMILWYDRARIKQRRMLGNRGGNNTRGVE